MLRNLQCRGWGRWSVQGTLSELSPGLERGRAHGALLSAPQMFRHTDSLFPILLQTLSDESDEVSAQHPSPVTWLPGRPFE